MDKLDEDLRLPIKSEEFYHLRFDPSETTNRFNDPAYQNAVDFCRTRFDDFLGEVRLELTRDTVINDIPSSIWGDFNHMIDFGFDDGTAALETTIANEATKSWRWLTLH